jgi:hypothetical protein
MSSLRWIHHAFFINVDGRYWILSSPRVCPLISSWFSERKQCRR